MTFAAAIAGLGIWWILQIPVFTSKTLDTADKILISVWSLIILVSIPVLVSEVLKGTPL